MRFATTVLSIIGTGFMIYNCLNPNTSIKNAGHVATAASTMLNRTNTLVNVGYGEDMEQDGVTCFADQDQEHEQEEYTDL